MTILIEVAALMNGPNSGCSCLYCMGTPSADLPVVVRVTHVHFIFSTWVIVSRPEKKMRFTCMQNAVLKHFDSIQAFARHEMQRRGVVCTEATPGVVCQVKDCNGRDVPFDRQCFQGRATLPPISNLISCDCVQFMPRRKVVKRARSPPSSPIDPLECEEQCVQPYTADEMGGDHHEVARAMQLHPKWCQETIDFLIMKGATPKLLRVERSFPFRMSQAALCTFIQPSGRLVRNIIVPLNYVEVHYPFSTTHL